MDADASSLRDLWTLPPGIAYLNHGSFGPSPRSVQKAARAWSDQVEAQPMEFFLQRMELAQQATCERISEFAGTSDRNIVLMDNATVAMNVVAATVELNSGDEVLLTNHEYGSVRRIWKRRCAVVGARVVTVFLTPEDTCQTDFVVDQLFAATTKRTRLIVVSHVTSSTSLVLPVKAVCSEARRRGIPVCVDGPHAVGMLSFSLDDLGCDFYTASCHKWMCAPFGSGFLYAHSAHHGRMQPVIISWGGSISGRSRSWKDEYTWMGTRDPAPMLSVSAAIDFLEEVGVPRFREHSADLILGAQRRLNAAAGLVPLASESSAHRLPMISISLPVPDGWKSPAHGAADPLQIRLRERYQIEIPVFGWNGQRLLRISCHLYNSEADIDRLVDALEQELP